MPRITLTLPAPLDGATDAEATTRAEADANEAVRDQLRAASDDAQAGELDARAYFGVDAAEAGEARPRRRERRHAQRGPAPAAAGTERGASPRRATQAGEGSGTVPPAPGLGEEDTADAVPDALAYYAATTNDGGSDDPNQGGRARLRRRDATTYPVRVPKAAGGAALPPVSPARQPHRQLLPLLQALRAPPVRLDAPASALLAYGVRDGALTQVPLEQLRRLHYVLAAHHPDSPLADDVRRAFVAKVREAVSAALGQGARLYADSKAYVHGGAHEAFVAQWGERAGALTQHANAHLLAERRRLPMLEGEGAVWHHCLETLRPYMLAVALSARSGERLSPRDGGDLLLSLATLQAILRSWLQDVGNDYDAVPPYTDAPPPSYG